MIPKESAMIGCSGALFGIGISEVVRKVIFAVLQTLRVAVSLDDLVRGSIIGLALGLLDAFCYVYKAPRIDPVRALSYG